jgi:hypothetical protein
VKKTPAKKPAKADESLEESCGQLFREQVSPLWNDDVDSNYPLEQPSPFKIVPSVTTYGISEAPIVG